MTKPFLSIIIPAFNEAERLPETMALLKDWIEQQDFRVDVWIVDDGSTDQTKEVVKQYQKRMSYVQLLENPQNLGKGGAVRNGMLAAQGTWRLFMDADGSTPINQLDVILKHLDEAPIIIGSRYLEPGRIKVKQPWKRRILSRFGNQIIQWMALPGISDTQCGFKLFRGDVAEVIFKQQHALGWLFDVELLTIAKELNYAIKEIPVDWYDAKQSTLRAARTGIKTLRELRQIRRRRQRGAYRHNS